MTLRKERRKICNALCTQLNRCTQNKEDLKTKYLKTDENLQHEKLSKSSIVEKLEMQKKIEIAELEERLKKEFKLEQERNKLKEKEMIMKVRRKYEEKIKLIETKLSEILIVKQQCDFSVAEKLAKEMVHKIKFELESKYLIEIQNCKDTLVILSNREQNLQENFLSQKKMVENLETERTALKIKIETLESNLNEIKINELNSQKQIIILTQQNEKNEKTVFEIASKLENLKKVDTLKMAELEKNHSQQLVMVDEKIRKVLETKNNELFNLRNELNVTKLNLKKTEKILVQINHDILNK